MRHRLPAFHMPFPAKQGVFEILYEFIYAVYTIVSVSKHVDPRGSFVHIPVVICIGIYFFAAPAVLYGDDAYPHNFIDTIVHF